MFQLYTGFFQSMCFATVDGELNEDYGLPLLCSVPESHRVIGWLRLEGTLKITGTWSSLQCPGHFASPCKQARKLWNPSFSKRL